jgi:hypothetical protein
MTMTDKTPRLQTAAQIKAAKRKEAFTLRVLKALSKTDERPMRKIAAKLKMTDANGSVSQSKATKIRTVLNEQIILGTVKRVNNLRNAVYLLA